MEDLKKHLEPEAEAEDSDDDLPLNQRAGTVTFDHLRCKRVYILRRKQCPLIFCTLTPNTQPQEQLEYQSALKAVAAAAAAFRA